MAFNKVILVGNLVADPELKQTPSGVSVATFTLAVQRRYAKPDDAQQADFINIVAWRQTAEFISRYFSKGKMILIEGELQTRSYTDKNNNTVRVTEIVADRATFTGEKSVTQNSPYQNYPGNAAPVAPAHPAENSNTAPAVSQGSASDFIESADDDDYPF